jgi:sec-independent protein translocase protein TatA
VIVGGRRLPALGRQLGEGMRGFKDSVTRRTDGQWEDEEARPALDRPAGEEEPVDGEVVRERSS